MIKRSKRVVTSVSYILPQLLYRQNVINLLGRPVRVLIPPAVVQKPR